MHVDDHGFASLPKFLSIVVFSGRFDGHSPEDSGASTRGSEGSFRHTSIFESGHLYVNREAIWLYRIRNCFQRGRLVPVLAAVYHGIVSGRGLLTLSEVVSSPQHSYNIIRIPFGKDSYVPFL